MMRKRAWLPLLAVVLLAAAGLVLLPDGGDVAEAADHGDPPTGLSANGADDIADYYAWHNADGNLVVALTLAGAAEPSADQTGTYDADVLYGIHFSNTGADGSPPYSSTHDIWVRFGDDSLGDWGIQVEGFPGETSPQEGAVETVIETGGGGQIWAGLADDPFFFDLEGFQDLVATGDATSFASLPPDGDGMFPDPRDSLAGTNATVIVMEFPAADVLDGGDVVHTWATASRIGG